MGRVGILAGELLVEPAGEVRRAFELNPNYAFAHDQFGLGLAFQGRLDESTAESRRAAELDPLNPQVPLDAIFALAWQGQYPAAREQVKRAADRGGSRATGSSIRSARTRASLRS